MRLKTLSLHGFKSFAQKTVLEFDNPIVAIVGPNGSGKSNVVEAIRYVLGEQSMKSMRGKVGADLIFKGSKSLSKGGRAGVSIYFDNKDKIFRLTNDAGEKIKMDYETVSISREVYPDGLNKYNLNGADVRLKDVHNLLASVNIGSSGHHIISQGEADRILSANARDRREMIEDALGLKVYQYKIKESERKLEKTQENMKEVTMLRRENVPHLNFLKKQVEKYEKAKEMQDELLALYHEYFKRESVYLETEEENLTKEKGRLTGELAQVNKKISGSVEEKNNNRNIVELGEIEKMVAQLREEKNELERKLGRIEGMLEAKENKVKLAGRCPLCGNVINEASPEQNDKIELDKKELADLKASHDQIQSRLKKIAEEEKEGSRKIDRLKLEINKEMEALRDLEREKFAWKVKHQELTSALQMIAIKADNLKSRKDAFTNEVREGVALIGEVVMLYKNTKVGDKIDLVKQEEDKRKIERLKIKLEDVGIGGGAEIMKEFKEVSERDQFLAKEMADLGQSIESLEKLITELKEKIDLEFKEGVKKINVEFQQFFALMFGGGRAALEIVTEEKRSRPKSGSRQASENDEEEYEDFEMDEEEGEPEKGVEINVSLPQKKVKELHALSGGERSLTSIALLFAMSQVNPPPFLVLDETDAALDEANSRKYGDMLEKLSKHSQLVVVTHNRETMSRAGVLYGVTIGSDGASKLLSVKFDEATAIAK